MSLLGPLDICGKSLLTCFEVTGSRVVLVTVWLSLLERMLRYLKCFSVVKVASNKIYFHRLARMNCGATCFHLTTNNETFQLACLNVVSISLFPFVVCYRNRSRFERYNAVYSSQSQRVAWLAAFILLASCLAQRVILL